MGAPPVNPQIAQMLAAMTARNTGGGPNPGPGGSPGAVANQPTPGGPVSAPGFGGPAGATPGGDAGADYLSSVMADLRRADPGMMGRQVNRMKQIFAAMLTFSLDTMPNVAGKIAKVIPHVDAILSEIQKASSVDGAVRNPIQMGAAMPTPQSPTSTGVGPGGMGAMGPMGS